MTNPPRLSLGKRLGFSLAVLLLVGALAEGLVRLSGIAAGKGFLVRTDVAWGMGANMDRPITSQDGMTFMVHTNDLGHRTTAEPEPATGETRTLLLLGDSIIFGWGVHDRATIGTFMQRRLDELYGPGSWRVINAAQPGYSSFQSYVLLREFGVRYEPDVVMLELAAHNNTWVERSDADTLGSASSGVSGLLQHLHVYRLLRRTLGQSPVATSDTLTVKLPRGGVSESLPEADGGVRRVSTTELDEIFAAMGDLGRAKGFKVFVNEPAFMRHPLDEEIDVLGAAQERGDIVWTDCGLKVDEANLFQRHLWVDAGMHWNEEGAHGAGRIYADCLASVGAFD